MVFKLLIFLLATYMFQIMCKIEACVTQKFLKMPLQNQRSQLQLCGFQESTTAQLNYIA